MWSRLSPSPDVRAGLRYRLSERVARWAARRNGVDSLPVTLGSSRIYILPTGIGFTYALGVFVMLLAAMNYNNSLAFILTFFLTAAGLVAMHLTHGNLANLELNFAGSASAFAGEPMSHDWVISNHSPRARFDLHLEAENDGQLADIDPSATTRYRLRTETKTRGTTAVPRLRIRSRFPLGLFQAWTWLNTEQRVTVWPRPALRQSVSLHNDDSALGQRNQATGDNDFDGLRDYQPGDSLRQVAWKTLASKNILATRQFAGGNGAPLWLRISAVRAAGLEEQLSLLARAALECFEQQRSFGLDLGVTRLDPGHGEGHLHKALDMLALHELPDTEPE